jgi:hypothetical protein
VTVKKKAPSRRRKTPSVSQLLVIDRVGRISLDLSPTGAREALVSLRRVLEANDGGPTVQFRLDPRDLNALYIYVPTRALKGLVGRLVALVELRKQA